MKEFIIPVVFNGIANYKVTANNLNEAEEITKKICNDSYVGDLSKFTDVLTLDFSVAEE
jgi:hypothetical protein